MENTNQATAGTDNKLFNTGGPTKIESIAAKYAAQYKVEQEAAAQESTETAAGDAGTQENTEQTAGTTEASGTESSESKAADTDKKSETAVDDSKNVRSRDFATLARKDKQNRDRESKILEKEKAFAAKEREYEQYLELKKTAKQDPIKAMREALGLTWEETQEWVVSGGKTSPAAENKSVKDEIAQLRKEQEDWKKAQQAEKAATVRAQQEAQVNAYYTEAHDFIKSNPDKYELTNSLKAFNIVDNYINQYAIQTYQETGTAEVLSKEDAADLVEKYLEEQASLVAATKKFKQKATPPVPKADQKSGSVRESRTISNSMTASSLGEQTAVAPKRETPDERRARIAAKYTPK